MRMPLFCMLSRMDWLSKHRAIVDEDKKTVLLKCFDLSEVTVQSIRSETMSNVVFIDDILV